jgi:oligoribonuclease NrnB/cAMP/cGMP phosphodiesterase (DHH superfamily)
MNIAIWTDKDLDGAGSALLLSILYNQDNISIYEWKYGQPGEIKGWLNANYDTFDKIFITDISIPKELQEYIDKEKVIIFDHHKTHVDIKDNYKVAKTFIKEETSCVRLISDTLRDKIKLTTPQKKLIDIIDDYDNYSLMYPETLKLNAIFSTYNTPRVQNFIKNFAGGIREFNLYELNSIKLIFNKLKETITNLQFFFGVIKDQKVVSCYCSSGSINEIAHYALKKTKSDIAIVVNLDTKAVSFRKTKKCPVDLSKIAEILCDGGGHPYAAGGKITQNFLKFTKTLTC